MKKSRQQEETFTLIMAMMLSIMVIMCWQYYFEAPRHKAEVAAIHARTQAEHQTKVELEQEAATLKPRPEILKQVPRVTIDSASLHGSIALKGLRFDDLLLARWHEGLEADSPEVILFTPVEEPDGYFAEFGWIAPDKILKVPGPDTLWTADASKLTPATPLTLTWKNPDGVTFRAHIALDEKYMFTVTQSASDASGKPLTLQTYAFLNRIWDMKKRPPSLVQEGPLGVFDGTLHEAPYKKLNEDKEQTFEASDGWLGVSDKYWLSAIVPPKESFTAHFSYYVSHLHDRFQADYLSAPALETTLHFFAGAKELNVLDAYAAQYHITLFDRAVDFGFFYWLAEPIFRFLSWLHTLIGNFGIAILLLTVLVKLVMYPLANKSFANANQMKELQPRMQEIRERFKADKVQMNQAIMELMKREKVNPASGCLPMLIQIPVFISLYKVLYVSIEMRHAPFYGWIHDLSAPDPTNLFTLFGLIPWTPPLVLHLGVWPILLCATMIIQQHQSPPPPDPTQAKMMKIMPFFFLFLFSNIAAGLAIYMTWSNLLSILQQWHIKHSHAKAKQRKAA